MEKDNKGLPVGIWIRVSTEDQAKGESPEHHRRRAERYAEFKEWNIVEMYDLAGLSGKSVMEYPETQRMLQDVKTGRIKGLLFSKLARLARNVRELLDLSDIFRNAGASLVSLEESIDTSTPAGLLFYTILAALAQWEREEIASRVKKSVEERAKSGKRLGGKAQFGFEWVPVSEDPECKQTKLVHSQREAPIVIALFETFLSEKKYLTTAKLVNAAGFRTRKGTLWGKTSVKRILTDEIYAGRRRLNYTQSKGSGRSWRFKDKSEWHYADVEPIISRKVFDDVQAIIAQIEQKYPDSGPSKSKYTFGGLVVCGKCDEKMYVSPYQGMRIPRYRCRGCRSKINEDILLQGLQDGLNRIIVHPEQLQAETKDDTETIVNRRERLKSLRTTLAGVERKIASVYELQSDQIITKDDFAERYKVLKVQKQQLQDEIPRLEAEISYMQVNEIAKKHLLDRATTLSALWDTLSSSAKDKIVKEVVSRIVVNKESINFELFYLPELMPGNIQVGKPGRNLRGSWRR